MTTPDEICSDLQLKLQKDAPDIWVSRLVKSVPRRIVDTSHRPLNWVWDDARIQHSNAHRHGASWAKLGGSFLSGPRFRSMRGLATPPEDTPTPLAEAAVR